MKTRRSVGVACALLFVASAGLAAQGDKVAGAPRTEMTYEAQVANAPDVGNGVALWSWGVERGYDAVGFAVDPGNPAAGSRWFSYDTGQRKPVTLTPDFNALVGQAAQPGLLGHRISAAREDAGLYGTAAAPGNGRFPGGHIVRSGKDLGSVGDGWSVVAFEPEWKGALKVGATSYANTVLAVVRSADGARYRVVGVGESAIVPLGIEGGPELSGICVVGQDLYYPVPGKQTECMKKSLVTDAVAAPADIAKSEGLRLALDPACRRLGGAGAARLSACFLLAPNGDLVRLGKPGATGDRPVAGRTAGLAAGLSEAQIDHWTGGEAWSNSLLPADNPEIVQAGGLQEGFVILARPGKTPTDAPSLTCYRPALDQPADLGPVAPFQGQALTKVYRLRALPNSGDVAVLAGNDKVTVLRIYRNPVMDIANAQLLAAMNKAGAAEGKPKVTARLVKSLYAFSPIADRTFGSMALASDGKVYFGVMPHDPVQGAPIFRYDPKSDELKHFGEFDAMAQTKGPGLITSMMHAPPVEINGRLYFTGQDPFYGGLGFPGMTVQNTRYAGSPLLMYDIRADQWTSLGIPLPKSHPGLAKYGGEGSIFHLAADPKRSNLYLRPGYGAGDWWGVKVGPDGRLADQPVEAAITPKPTSLLFPAEDGMMYYSYVRKEKSPADSKAGPPGEMYRYNPATNKTEKLATYDVIQLNGGDFPPQTRVDNGVWWLGESSGQMVGYFYSVDMVFTFDQKSTKITKIGVWPRRGTSGFAVQKGRVWHFLRERPAKYPADAVGVMVMDLNSGKVTDLGRLVDNQGRWFYQVTDACFTREGKMCLSAEDWSGPGDPYCRRYRAPVGRDSCLWVIDNPDAVAGK